MHYRAVLALVGLRLTGASQGWGQDPAAAVRKLTADYAGPFKGAKCTITIAQDMGMIKQ